MPVSRIYPINPIFRPKTTTPAGKQLETENNYGQLKRCPDNLRQLWGRVFKRVAGGRKRLSPWINKGLVVCAQMFWGK